MTSVNRPRRPLHRGSVLASGLLVDPRIVGEGAARRRVLDLRESGLEVLRSDPFIVVRFREPIRTQCASAPGAPLVRYGHVHSIAPLARDEERWFEGAAESVVIVDGGVATALPIAGADREDLSLWLDVSEFEVDGSAISLGPVASCPTTHLSQVSPDIRGPLQIEPLAAEGVAVTASLTALGEAGRNGAGRDGLSSRATAAVAVVRDIAAFIFKQLFGQAAAGTVPGVAPRGGLATASSSTPSGASWFARVKSALQHAAARLLVWSKLAPFVSRRQARYLEQMLEMFDDGDLDRALHHAIPLTTSVAAALTPPALRVPSPRTNLAIVPDRTSPTSTTALGENLFDFLKQKYRHAFDRLVEQGEIEKAAFVLAELLDASEEAVSFLERRGRLELAAEIAEARGLSPGLVVRQWFLAGKKERAIRLARSTRAFADAVTRLERTHADEGKALRLVWADSLAQAGAYAAAVDVAWPVEDARELTREWLERAIAVGGPTGARMLVKKLRLCPDRFTDVRDAVLALLADDDARIAHALAREVLAGNATEGTRVIAKVAARRLLAERHDKDTARLVRRLLEASGDAAFLADATACGVRTQGTASSPTAAVRLQAFSLTDRGKVRSYQEDACVAAFLSDRTSAHVTATLDGDVDSLGVVLGAFDGRGGESSGRMAAELAGRTILEVLQRDFASHSADVEPWARCISAAMDRANRDIFRAAATNDRHRGMGCTATVATLSGCTLLVAHVGDTRGYVLRDGQLVQVTKDHTLFNDFVAAGSARSELEDVPKNVVTRSMGSMEDVTADVVRVDLCRGDVILLCSDGLSSVVDEKVIRDALLERAPQLACKALLSAALEAGAPDNIAIVVAHVDGADLPSPAGTAIRCESIISGGLDGQGIATTDDLRSRRVALVVHRERADAGALPVLDAAELPDGRVLVALGEIGAWILGRDGKVLVRFAEPADQLVISDHGDRALLVARRGEAYRTARVDLVTHRIRPWCDARIYDYARTFDGSTWFVSSHEGTLFEIDATSSDWEHVWSISEDRAFVTHMVRSDTTLSVRVDHELWTFDVPHRLRSRLEMPDDIVCSSSSGTGLIAAWRRKEGPTFDPDATAEVFAGGKWKPLPLTARMDRQNPHHTPWAADDWVAFPVLVDEGMVVHVFDVKCLRERAVLRLDGGAVHLRFQDDRLLVYDTCGRVLVLSLETGAVLREFRVS